MVLCRTFLNGSANNLLLFVHKVDDIQENAQAPVWFTLTNSEPDNLIKGMRAYSQLQLQNGITTVQYMGTGFKQKEASDILQKANISQRIRLIAWPLSTYNGRVLSEWKDDNTHPTSLLLFPVLNILLMAPLLNKIPLIKNLTAKEEPGTVTWNILLIPLNNF